MLNTYEKGLIIDAFAGGGGASVGIEMALGRTVDIAINHVKDKEGQDYQKFISAMRDLGYAFDSRELVAADYGAPTTRKRWYAIFRRDGKPIFWPKPTHSKTGGDGLLSWEPCGKYIDWSNLGRSIFNREKPLADATMRRIANGFVKYVVNNPDPYLVENEDAYAFLIQYHGGEKTSASRGQSLNEPVKTIDTSNRYGLVTAFVTKFYGTSTGHSCNDPLHTITTSAGHFGVVSAFLIKYYGTGGGQTCDSPIGTITTKDRFGLVSSLVEIKGETYVLKDIFLRMLKPEELKVMQGFPADYIIDRDSSYRPYPIKEQVARIGNSVVPVMAKKLVEANCGYLKTGERRPGMRIDCTGPQLRMVV